MIQYCIWYNILQLYLIQYKTTVLDTIQYNYISYCIPSSKSSITNYIRGQKCWPANQSLNVQLQRSPSNHVTSRDSYRSYFAFVTLNCHLHKKAKLHGSLAGQHLVRMTRSQWTKAWNWTLDEDFDGCRSASHGVRSFSCHGEYSGLLKGVSNSFDGTQSGHSNDRRSVTKVYRVVRQLFRSLLKPTAIHSSEARRELVNWHPTQSVASSRDRVIKNWRFWISEVFHWFQAYFYAFLGFYNRNGFILAPPDQKEKHTLWNITLNFTCILL